MGATALAAIAGSATAGEFDGVAFLAKLIGGQQYEALYGRTAEGCKLFTDDWSPTFDSDAFPAPQTPYWIEATSMVYAKACCFNST